MAQPNVDVLRTSEDPRLPANVCLPFTRAALIDAGDVKPKKLTSGRINLPELSFQSRPPVLDLERRRRYLDGLTDNTLELSNAEMIGIDPWNEPRDTFDF
jgi:hypothetical protein